jgi:hypothetical protein
MRTDNNAPLMRTSRTYPMHKLENLWHDGALPKECTKFDYFNSRIVGLDAVRGMNKSVFLLCAIMSLIQEILLNV